MPTGTVKSQRFGPVTSVGTQPRQLGAEDTLTLRSLMKHTTVFTNMKKPLYSRSENAEAKSRRRLARMLKKKSIDKIRKKGRAVKVRSRKPLDRIANMITTLP